MINGRTRLYATLADPIGHVRAPDLFNARFAAAGTDAVMVPMHVPPPALATTLAALAAMQNFVGAIITVPHKPAVVAHLDRVTDAARQVGAANVVRRLDDGRLAGTMVDGDGFVRGLSVGGIQPAGASILLVGAGGAGAAIAFALAGAGAARLTIANRDRTKAERLAARVVATHPDCQTAVGAADPGGHDLIVNATSVGLLASDPYPLDVDSLVAGQIIAEAIMNPPETRLLAAARERGCRVHPGRHMLEQQLDLMAAFMDGPEAQLRWSSSA